MRLTSAEVKQLEEERLARRRPAANPPKVVLAKAKLREPAYRSKTEADYADYLKADPHVVWWRYEGVKLRLAGATFLTVDFFVVKDIDYALEAHEVKGWMREDANVKLKVAAEIYPFVFFMVKRVNGKWKITGIPRTSSSAPLPGTPTSSDSVVYLRAGKRKAPTRLAR